MRPAARTHRHTPYATRGWRLRPSVWRALLGQTLLTQALLAALVGGCGDVDTVDHATAQADAAAYNEDSQTDNDARDTSADDAAPTDAEAKDATALDTTEADGESDGEDGTDGGPILTDLGGTENDSGSTEDGGVAPGDVTDTDTLPPQDTSEPKDTMGAADTTPQQDSGSTATDTMTHQDAGAADTGVADTGFADSGPADSGPADSGPADTGTFDAGVTDAGTPNVPPLTIPMVVSTNTTRVATAGRCSICHSNSTKAKAMRDSKSRPVGMWDLWRGTMMANSARDPLWRAAVSAEVATVPSAKGAIEKKCMTCHSPLAHIERKLTTGQNLTMKDLEGSSDVSQLARDGVSCTSCHRIEPDKLGTDASFSGNFVVKDNKQIYGPFSNPFKNPMVFNSKFTPVQGKHITQSKLCASCHTLFTSELTPQGKPTGVSHTEQAPYLEWQASAFNTEVANPSDMAKDCQGCHAPQQDVDGNGITTKIAHFPNGNDMNMISPRAPYGRHVFVGGNTLIPTILRDNQAQLAPDVAKAAYDSVIVSARAQLQQRTADLVVSPVTVQGGVVKFSVTVKQKTGHKFPTGYPSRRTWLRVRIRDANGNTLLAMGDTDQRGRILRPDGSVQPFEYVGGPTEPHRDSVTAVNQLPIWETVMATSSGKVTYRLMLAGAYLKDNRLLPIGWQASHPSAKHAQPVGLGGDTNFKGGSDTVTFALPLGKSAQAKEVVVDLLYQPLSTRYAAELIAVKTLQTQQFRLLYDKVKPLPEQVATQTRVITP